MSGYAMWRGKRTGWMWMSRVSLDTAAGSFGLQKIAARLSGVWFGRWGLALIREGK
ncbi:MAG: hypothetical protein VW405_10975 [Rhodospirillaceae bacterium]